MWICVSVLCQLSVFYWLYFIYPFGAPFFNLFCLKCSHCINKIQQNLFSNVNNTAVFNWNWNWNENKLDVIAFEKRLTFLQNPLKKLHSNMVIHDESNAKWIIRLWINCSSFYFQLKINSLLISWIDHLIDMVFG